MEVQPAEERLAAAAAKLLQSSNAGTQRRRECYSKEHQSPRADYSIKHADLLSRKLARCWKKFALSKKTTLALVQAYASTGINGKNMSFESLAMVMESPPVLQATRALLDRLETRLMISGSSAPVENIDHLLKHLAAPPPRRTKPAAAPRPRRAHSSGLGTTTSPPPAAAVVKTQAAVTATQQSSSQADWSQENRRQPRYSLRVVLCAYMIVAHPAAVLSGQRDGESETQLMESAARFVGELELLTKTVVDDGASASGKKKFRDQLAAFDGAWCAYLYRFVAWKARDAAALEGDLVGAACRLELSMLQTCKLTAADGQHQSPSPSPSPSPGNKLTHDMEAVQRQVADDQKLLRDKVRLLSGDAGVARMDSALSDTRSKFFDAKKNASPVAKPVEDDVATPALSIDSSSENSSPSPVKQPTENERLVNEKLHHQDDDGSAFAGKSDSAAAEKDFQEKFRETMEKAFWDLVTDSMTGDKPDYSYLVSLVKEVRDSLHELSPKGWKEEIMEKIDVEILSQVLVGSGSQDAQYLVQILQYSLGMVRRLSAAVKEDQMKRSHDKLLTELAASSEADAIGGTSSFVVGAVKGLRFALEEIKQLRAEVSTARIHLAMQRITQGSNGVDYLKNAFADRHGSPASAGARASLPLTARWISASRNVAGQEWREHLGSLSVVPPSAAACLVSVLRAGHGGAAVRQPSSSSSLTAAAGGVSGQPECKGDELDKLVRIGLLQLISGVEGLQMQSTPESFQLNLMRLRAVQSQFQQVIVIATSMLILRQVLMGESSKPTTLELENATAELFEALVKMLDGGNPDAGGEEIVEAMMSASASVGSPSEEKMQGRRQTAARVLLKSLQPGDAVFRMVFRAVFCAFRGIVLGGSGQKGQKLAEAALRRVGAARLVGRVVKTSEVLIKVATVSGKVHGPWYKALL